MKAILMAIYFCGVSFIAPLSAVDQTSCSKYGCYIKEKGKIILPLWSFRESVNWYRKIQTESQVTQFDKIATELVKIRLILSRNIDERIRRDLERNEKYLEKILDTKYQYIQPKVFPIPSVDLTDSFDFSLQKYALSCEISAASLISTHLGITISEEQFARKIQYSGIEEFDGEIWGNPDEGFVGKLNGSQRKLTGYGVYERPIAQVLNTLGLKTEIINEFRYNELALSADSHLRLLLLGLHKGARIELWGDWCTQDKEEDGLVSDVDMELIKKYHIAGRNHCDTIDTDRSVAWKTLTGDRIEGLIGEHTFILLGYIGPIENPTHIIVWDTDTGRHIYSINEWKRKWKLLNNRSLIVQI